jgi:hypothetical protein
MGTLGRCPTPTCGSSGESDFRDKGQENCQNDFPFFLKVLPLGISSYILRLVSTNSLSTTEEPAYFGLVFRNGSLGLRKSNC